MSTCYMRRYVGMEPPGPYMPFLGRVKDSHKELDSMVGDLGGQELLLCKASLAGSTASHDARAWCLF